MAEVDTMADGGYHPDWVALEKVLGTRPVMSGNREVDVAVFNQMGRSLQQQWAATSPFWPGIDDELDMNVETVEPEQIPVKIYRPRSGGDNLPLMVYFHGGGYISGDLETEDPQCKIFAAKTPCVVVSVDYPLAPEHKIDHIIATAIRAVEWSTSHNPPLTKSSQLMLAGGSAGASLAIQVAYAAATSGKPVGLTGLLAMFPFCAPVDHYSGKYAEMHKSYDELATGAPFLTKAIVDSVAVYADIDRKSPKHYPLNADSLSGFPKTLIITAEKDPCRDDGKILARRLREESDKEVQEIGYDGLPHYFHWFPTVPTAHEMMNRAVQGAQWIIET